MIDIIINIFKFVFRKKFIQLLKIYRNKNDLRNQTSALLFIQRPLQHHSYNGSSRRYTNIEKLAYYKTQSLDNLVETKKLYLLLMGFNLLTLNSLISHLYHNCACFIFF